MNSISESACKTIRDCNRSFGSRNLEHALNERVSFVPYTAAFKTTGLNFGYEYAYDDKDSYVSIAFKRN